MIPSIAKVEKIAPIIRGHDSPIMYLHSPSQYKFVNIDATDVIGPDFITKLQ